MLQLEFCLSWRYSSFRTSQRPRCIPRAFGDGSDLSIKEPRPRAIARRNNFHLISSVFDIELPGSVSSQRWHGLCPLDPQHHSSSFKEKTRNEVTTNCVTVLPEPEKNTAPVNASRTRVMRVRPSVTAA